jgi:hypothetical protein
VARVFSTSTRVSFPFLEPTNSLSMNRNDRLNCRLDGSVNIDPYRLDVKMMIISR